MIFSRFEVARKFLLFGMRMLMSQKYCFIVLLGMVFPWGAVAQGKMALVGGGSEAEGGWSDLPYAWAVENSSNKKVAVISYADEDNFIPDYFISLGAAEAVNIKIDTRAIADLQSTYDALMEYDVFFFKGGDQYIYYNNYRNTKTALAIIDKFQSGGVIAGTSAGMAILSGVIFTAENGSVYPDEALKDFKQSKITLADDFLPLFPGYIFDSHFTERGRVGRLLPFMANWFVNKGDLIRGIGVDDRTALCIDSDKRGWVYGTGSVSVYTSDMFSSFEENKPLADSVHAIQLLHGHSLDLETLAIISGPESTVVPEISQESGNYQVILSGSEGLSANTKFINHFLNDIGKSTDTVVVVTASGKGKSFIQRLASLGAKYVVLETDATANDISQIDLRNNIRRSKKVLFVENDDAALFNFMENGPTGRLLKEHLRRNNIVSGFVGEDSRYAGKVWVSNHLSDALAAYYGRLEYRAGLNLLQSSVIMSNTYDANDADFYENTTASVSYAMMADRLKYGIYLNRNSFLKFYQQPGKNYFQANGDLSTVVMVNEGTAAALASQPVSTMGSARNYVGFSSLQYILLNGESVIDAGTPAPSADVPYEFEIPVVGVDTEFNRSSINVFPNPSNRGIFYLSGNIPTLASLSVTDIFGRRLILEVCCRASDMAMDLSSYPDGIYLITIRSRDKVFSFKGIKNSKLSP